MTVFTKKEKKENVRAKHTHQIRTLTDNLMKFEREIPEMCVRRDKHKHTLITILLHSS